MHCIYIIRSRNDPIICSDDTVLVLFARKAKSEFVLVSQSHTDLPTQADSIQV